MNKIININQVTMSSREVAELTGKEHKNVMADIRNMFEELGVHSAEFSAQYQDSTGRMLPCFNLPKKLTLNLVSGYSAKLRMKIIDRLEELENSIKPLSLIDSTKLLIAMLEDEQRISEELRLNLDESKQWFSIKRVAFCNDVKWTTLSWRNLKHHGVLNGKEPRKVFDSNFGEINVYHRSTWSAIYPNLILPNGEDK